MTSWHFATVSYSEFLKILARLLIIHENFVVQSSRSRENNGTWHNIIFVLRSIVWPLIKKNVVIVGPKKYH